MDTMKSVIEQLKPTLVKAAIAVAKDNPGIDGDELVAKVSQEAAAVIVNQTNQEPWTQSTVTGGAIIGIVSSIYGLLYNAVMLHQIPTPAELPVALGGLISGAIVIYGRWFRQKPLGQ